MVAKPKRQEAEEDAVLAALKQQAEAFLAGQELGRRAGVPTDRVLAAVEALQAQGYRIASRPDSGYRLVGVPDSLLPAELRDGLATRIVGSKIVCYGETDSTMDLARQLAEAGTQEGVCVFAESQVKGRGRFSRTWVSPRRDGIYVSIVLRPSISSSEASQLTLLSAVAVCDAVRSATGLPAALKWPNDVVLMDSKVSGVLTDMKTSHGRLEYVIIGIGLNVNMPRESLPQGATSLRQETGGDVDRLQLCRVLMQSLETWYLAYLKEGFEAIKAAWVERSATLGRYVQVEMSNRQVEGQAVALSGDGALLVRRQDGMTESVLAGDVVRLR